MIEENSTYFEISEGGSFIQIELLELSHSNTESDWDKNWINAIVNVKAGAFSGKFKAEFLTIDFISFKNELENLYNKLNGIATFYTLEEQVVIKVTGDGIGHMKAECIVMDSAGIGNKLEFDIDFDQTHIPKILNQLQRITLKFPKIGELN